MLFTPNPTAIEASDYVKINPMTYSYEDLLNQLKQAGMNPWINNWNEVIEV